MLNKTKALSFIINNFKTLKNMEKKVYEAPEVTKVEIDFSDRIVAAGCTSIPLNFLCENFGGVPSNS